MTGTEHERLLSTASTVVQAEDNASIDEESLKSIGGLAVTPLPKKQMRPAEQYPGVFGNWTLFITYPYLLPCLAGAAVTMLGWIAGYFLFEEARKSETLGGVQHAHVPVASSSASSVTVNPTNYGTISENRDTLLQANEEQSKPDSMKDQRMTAPEIIRDPIIRRILVSYTFLALVTVSIDAVWVLWLYMPIAKGGVGFTTSQIGIILSCRRVGTVALYRTGMRLQVVMVLLFPLVSKLAAWDADATGGTPGALTEKSSSAPTTPPDHPSNALPDSPFSSLFDPPPHGTTSSARPLFPVIVGLPSAPKEASNAPKTDPTESPSSTFGEFVSSDPLQNSQLSPSFSPLERSPLASRAAVSDSVSPNNAHGEATQPVPWLSAGTTTGALTFVQEATARTKARADKVMGELLGRDAQDPLGWLSTEGNRDGGVQDLIGPQEPFDDWDGLDSLEIERMQEEKEQEMLEEIADRGHLPKTPRASRSGSPADRSALTLSATGGSRSHSRQSDSDDDIIDLRTGKRERLRGRPVGTNSHSSASNAIPIRRPAAEPIPHPNQPPSSSMGSSYLNFTLPRKWFSTAGPSPPQVSGSNSAPKTGLTRQMSSGEFTELPHPNFGLYGGSGTGGTISAADSPRASLSGLFEPSPVTPFAKKAFAPISGAPAFRPDDDWNPSGFEYDSKSKKDTMGSERLKLAGRNESTIPVLSGEVADMLRPHLPPLPRLAKTWTLLYSTDQHGISISTLYKNVEKVYGMNGGCVLAVREAIDEDGDGDIDAHDVTQARTDLKSSPCFGVWLGTGLKCNEGSYYGSGESFLWKTIGPNRKSHFGSPSEVKVFKWTGRNDYVALCESDYLSFGGGDGKYGLYVDSSFVDGTSERCDTFANETLCGEHDIPSRARFECLALEHSAVLQTTTTGRVRVDSPSTVNIDDENEMSTPPPRQRSPLFYCYECHTEARPLMVPDPHCASCNSTFVEEIPPENTDSTSNPDLDPRNFQVDPDPNAAGFGDFFGPGAPGSDPIITLMNMLMARPLVQPPGRPGLGRMGGGYGTTLRFDMSNGQGRVTFQSGGSGSPLGG
ncbi:oxidation resistance protein 1 [Tulasnella sp. 417]|nr:oxidation resistance protein 1 [Tulasnella sp. 417]